MGYFPRMPESPADKLRRARIARGFATAAQAARAHGWSVVTYTSHENGTRGLRPDAAARYAKAFGLSPSDLLGLRNADGTQSVPVIGGAAMGVWRDTELDSEQKSNGLSVVVISTGVQSVQFALEVLDNSINKLIKIGEFAICTPLGEADLGNLTVGALVVVDRTRGALRERSIRRVAANAGRLELQTESTEKKMAETVECPSRRRDEVVTVIGRVIGKYAPL